MINHNQNSVFGKYLSFIAIGVFFILGACATRTTSPAPISNKDRHDGSRQGSDIVERREFDGSAWDVYEGIEDATTPIEGIPETVVENPLLTPTHMVTRNIRRIGVLLPFSHKSASVRKEASSLLAAIELALFDHADENILIIPKDTGGDQNMTTQAVREALMQGVEIFIGPVFRENVQIAATLGAGHVPVIGFSTDLQAAGGGAYLMSIPPEEEVRHIVQWAVDNGIVRFALFAPDSAYGRQVEQVLRYQTAFYNSNIISVEFYPVTGEAPVEAAKRLAQTLIHENDFTKRELAIMIPEGGQRLKSVAPLLPYYGVNPNNVIFLGTGRWNNPSLWREPTLIGGAFAAPEPEELAAFSQAYRETYDRSPSQLASLGYDAAAMVIQLIRKASIDRERLEHYAGFKGVNGLFRFGYDGSIERALSVVSITETGLDVIESADSQFFDIGG